MQNFKDKKMPRINEADTNYKTKQETSYRTYPYNLSIPI